MANMAKHHLIEQAPPRQPNWWQQLERLNALLEQHQFPTSADRWQNASDLLLRLATQQRLPADARELRPLLTPLFSRSAREQTQFKALFDQWLATLNTEQQHKRTDPVAVQAQHRQAPAKPPPTPWRIYAAAVAVMLLIGAVGLAYYWSQDEGTITPPPRQTAPPPVSEVPVVKPQPVEHLKLQSVPPRRPLEAPRLSEKRSALLAAVVPATWIVLSLLGVLYLLRCWLTWQTVLTRRDDGNPRHAQDPLHHISLAGTRDELLDAPQLRAALRRLHAPVAFTTRRLQADATVRATARNAGLFQPVYRERLQVPEVVVLLDYRHGADHMAALAALACQRLQDEGLRVHRYTYQQTPNTVREDRPGGRWFALADIAALFPGARLLLVGEPVVLVDPWTETLRPLADHFTGWPQRALLATRLPPDDWVRLLQAQGMAVADLSSAGLAKVAEYLSGAPPQSNLSSTVQPLPPLLQTNERWLSPVAPAEEQQRALLRCLDDYLGADGSLLLATLAAYPSVHWGLTRVLDLNLFPGDGAPRREQRLLRIARLPWCRAGGLPDWLRDRLKRRRTGAEQRRIHTLYQALLGRARIDGEGEIALPFDLPARPTRRWQGLRHWLRWLQASAPDNSALRDRIFAETLLGRPRLIDLLMPAALVEQLPAGWPRVLLPRIALTALLVSGTAISLQAAWQHSGGETVGAMLLVNQQGDYAAYQVDIVHVAETLPLAQALAETLALHEFETPPLVELSATTLDTNSTGNTVQWSEPAQAPVANYIAQQLARLSWGLAPQVVDTLPVSALPEALKAPPGLRVWLFTAGRTGSRFSDDLSALLSPEQRMALGQAFQPPAKKLSVPAKQRAHEVEPLPSFRDPLRDGGQGPELIALPAGSFLMGSPEHEPERVQDEGPQHSVNIAPFALGRTEVTFDDYDRFAKATERRLPDDEGWGRGQRPVINVSWQDAQDYAAWLTEQTGHRYRLPSEAEWEYATRAGTTTAFNTGDCIHTDQANYNGEYDYNDCGAKTSMYRGKTMPAGSFAANPWGLHDLHGNVWEWVQDCWHESYVGAPVDGNAWEKQCSQRVVRGGGWYSEPKFLRSAYRGWNNPDRANSDRGFRFARIL